ncbi:MAG: cytochrome c biogenesis protein CcdA [Rugosibacter sp.]|nr:MAG: cytochrome c biogenesis protein CcdA [Rugosibacter sp.]TBR11767.1 MAG: cytochrome c biogenesis protein CcdA [Rugosibacter sp.]
MNIELTAIPLAFFAGMFGVLSPCVWPLVPIVMGSAASGGRFGPYALAVGLSLSFAIAGTLLSWLLLSVGLDPELFRYLAAALLVVVALTLINKAIGDWLTLRLSRLASRFNVGTNSELGWTGQFFVGLLLGLVWLPCVGPTLGAAIALASMGQNLVTAFIVMLAFGVGTASVLLLAGQLSGSLLSRLRPGLLRGGSGGKKLLGWVLLLLGVLVLTGGDKLLEAWAVSWLPEWASQI